MLQSQQYIAIIITLYNVFLKKLREKREMYVCIYIYLSIYIYIYMVYIYHIYIYMVHYTILLFLKFFIGIKLISPAWTTALSWQRGFSKWSCEPCLAVPPKMGQVIVERFDKIWSTGEDNSLQYFCPENPMGSMKGQKVVLPEPLQTKQLHNLHTCPHGGKPKSSRAASGVNPSGQHTSIGGDKTTIETQGQCG